MRVRFPSRTPKRIFLSPASCLALSIVSLEIGVVLRLHRAALPVLRFQFRLDLFRTWQRFFELRRKRLHELRGVARHSYWRRNIAQRVFSDDLAARLAQNQTDGQLVLRVPQLIVNR